MARHNETGSIGEQKAADFLTSSGYTILERNWRPGRGHLEVDIIAHKDDVLVIVEVKTRTSVCFGEPESFVGYSKSENLVKAANAYIRLTNPSFSQIRFDIISVVMTKASREVVKLTHFENAFRPRPRYY